MGLELPETCSSRAMGERTQRHPLARMSQAFVEWMNIPGRQMAGNCSFLQDFWGKDVKSWFRIGYLGLLGYLQCKIRSGSQNTASLLYPNFFQAGVTGTRTRRRYLSPTKVVPTESDVNNFRQISILYLSYEEKPTLHRDNNSQIYKNQTS